MIICPNCGAEIEEDAAKCPFCGYINIQGAEKKFNEEIDEIKSNIVEVKKEPGRALKWGFLSGVKTVIVSIVIILVLVILVVILAQREFQDRPPLFLTAEQEAFASAYKVQAKEKIAEAYENKDIELLAEIFDKAYSEDRVSLWGDPHYEAAQAASNYMNLKRCLPNLEKDNTTKKEAEEITYYCFYFYYSAYGDDGADLFDSIRENEILPMIQTRLGFTIEDMEAFRSEVTDSGLVNRSEVYRVAKKQFKNYH